MSNINNQEISIDYILQEDYEIDDIDKYKLEDLKIGMRVHTKQLEDIYYTYILIANPILIDIGDNNLAFAGTIVYIGKEQNEELLNAWNKYTINKGRPCKIYNIPNLESEQFVCEFNN